MRVLVLCLACGLVLAIGFAAAGALFPGAAPTAPVAVLETTEAASRQSSPAVASSSDDAGRHDARPNIIVVYVDDMRATDLSIMRNVKQRLAANGVSFTNSVVSTSACCPARATHLSGQYSHNSGVLHNSPPFGGYGAFKNGVQTDGNVLPIWLQDAGYRTVFFGKFMNHYPPADLPGEVPPGFSDWYGLYEGSFNGMPFTIYRQTRYLVRVRPGVGEQPLLDPERAQRIFDAPDGGDGQLYVFDGPDTHQTEVLMDGAIRAVDQQREDSAPMYLNVWLTAPHTGGDGAIVGGKDYPRRLRPFTTRPADPELSELSAQLRRGNGLGDFRLRRTAAFNERNVADKPAFVRKTRRMNRGQVKDTEIRNALRLASLKSVDRKVDQLLDAIGAAERRTGRPSYVVFSSDGGYFLGEHRLPYEKNWHYGAASDVPLIIRGPGVARGVRVSVPVGNVDLASTFLAMAGESLRVANRTVDGRSLLPLLQRSREAPRSLAWSRRTLLLEGFYGRTTKPRYVGARNRRWVYVEHRSGGNGRVTFRELYDLQRDPAYTRNLLHGRTAPPTRAVARRLARALRQLRSCAGHDCRAVYTRS